MDELAQRCTFVCAVIRTDAEGSVPIFYHADRADEEMDVCELAHDLCAYIDMHVGAIDSEDGDDAGEEWQHDTETAD